MDLSGRDSTFQNLNAAVDFLKLASGNLLLVFNDSMTQRTPLVAALSTDGDAPTHVAETSPKARRFRVPDCAPGADGRIHAIYTSNQRQVINHAVFTESWLLGGAAR